MPDPGRHCVRWTAVAVGALLALANVTSARAGDDSACYMEVPSFPEDGAIDVARNTIIVDRGAGCLYGSCSTSLTVRDASGTETARYSYLLAEDLCVPIYRPSELLAANTVYCVEETYACFTTGTEVDDDPPAFVLGADGPDRGLDMAWTGSPDIVMITMSVGSGLGIWGFGMQPEDPLVHTTGAKEDGDTLTLTAWDRAGNSTKQTVKLNMPGGCQSGPTSDSGSPWLLLLALLGLLARRLHRENRGRT